MYLPFNITLAVELRTCLSKEGILVSFQLARITRKLALLNRKSDGLRLDNWFAIRVDNVEVIEARRACVLASCVDQDKMYATYLTPAPCTRIVALSLSPPVLDAGLLSVKVTVLELYALALLVCP
jgi:hypothetical protein